jgi:acetolactate synthase-1/3 small subunit
MANDRRSNVHTISILVANKPGVLVRCAQIFARRGFNIDALVVSPAVNPKFSRMTITAQGDPATLDQIIKQTAKLVDVLHCSEHSGLDAVDYELDLVKLRVSPQSRPVVEKLAKKYGAKIIDQTDKIIILALSGATGTLDEFESFMKKYGILEAVRSGKLVMARGSEET